MYVLTDGICPACGHCDLAFQPCYNCTLNGRVAPLMRVRYGRSDGVPEPLFFERQDGTVERNWT